MKKIDRFILRSFVGPFFAILLVVIFVLLMQFLWLYIDELVGKGLSIKVIIEFLGWGGATLLPLSLPLATLLASMMTLGTLGENNELLAIKAAGISLQRILVPLSIVCAGVCVGAYFISNDLIPLAYNKIYTLRDDIGKTKEEIRIPTGTFYDGIDGYILRVDKRDKKTGQMYGVMVYNHTKNKGNVSPPEDVTRQKLPVIPPIQWNKLRGDKRQEIQRHDPHIAENRLSASGAHHPCRELFFPKIRQQQV